MSFESHAKTLVALRHALDILRDAECVCGMSSDDREKLFRRDESLIEDEAVSAALVRLGTRIGRVFDDLEGVGCHITDEARKAWSAFLTTPDYDPSILLELFDTYKSLLDAKRVTLEEIEHDTGSSSYSDYSDSKTDSETEEEDDESEEDESE